MGFDVDISRSVLKHYGDVTKSIERLLETGGLLPPECQETDKPVGIVSELGMYDIFSTSLLVFFKGKWQHWLYMATPCAM